MKNNQKPVAQNLVHTLLNDAVHVFAERIFLLYKDQMYSYQQFFDMVMHCAQKMLDSGVTFNDKVLIVAENTPLFYVGYFASWQIGAIAVPVNNFLKLAEIEHIIQDCQPSFLICDEHRVDFLQTEVTTTVFKGIFTQQSMSFDPWQKEPINPPLDQLNPDELAVLVYTSGTTGVPKGVMLSSRNILTNINQCVTRLEIGSEERVLCVLPLFHVFTQITCVWLAIKQGVSVVIVPKIERSHIIDGLAKKPTIVLGVPALFGLFCLFRNLDFSHVRLFVAGGDAMPDKIRSLFALLYGRKIINGYGLSEASPVVAVHLDDVMTYTNTIGKPLDGIIYQIRPLADSSQAPYDSPYQIGQLFIRGDNVMLGYYHDQKATEHALPNGWLDTGDCAYFDNDKNIVITGREKDLIISKGFNIYPQEVENIIALSQSVIRVAVVGKDDQMHGQVPIAFVQLRQEQKGIEKELSKLCAHHLASYKIPRLFICSTEALPTTATGKVDKKQLKKQLQEN